MEIQTIKCWEDFEELSRKIISKVREEKTKPEKYVSMPLFRGQSNSEWPLKSTLDRVREGMRISEYYEIITKIHNDIATNTGKRWISDEKVLSEISRSDLLPYDYDIQYDDEYSTEKARFMIYLRHNAFPSPLLDWTQSPYIAAFFAFSDLWPEKKPKYVSIFVYQEYTGLGKSRIAGEPYIHTIGSNVETDKKHYLQQSEYLICVIKERRSGSRKRFANYENVEKTYVPAGGQDALIKINIPVSEQAKVLDKLNLMNINAYSLFTSESSLMETLSVREFILPNQ